MIRNALGFLANDLCVSRIVRLRFVNYGKSFLSRGSCAYARERIS
jgi:hypothetical protein